MDQFTKMPVDPDPYPEKNYTVQMVWDLSLQQSYLSFIILSTEQSSVLGLWGGTGTTFNQPKHYITVAYCFFFVTLARPYRRY
jgi:hypothetical protein